MRGPRLTVRSARGRCEVDRRGIGLKPNHKSMLFIVVVVSLLCRSALAYPEHPVAEQACDESVMKLAGEKLKLRGLSKLETSAAPDEQSTGRAIASVCKRWPAHADTVLAAIAYDGGADGAKQLILALLDPKKGRVVSRFQRAIEDDASTEFGSHSLWLDMAPYRLAKNTMAFALRVNAFRERCPYDGGFGDELELFVENGAVIRPVFQATMSEWTYGPGDRCGGAQVSISHIDRTISIEPTMSNGFADLKLSEVDRESKKRTSTIEQYNGCFYVAKPWTPSKACQKK